jgi:signal transduction histidine kinase
MDALASRAGRRAVPRRTIRLRLTALYGSVFLASSAGLLTLTYFVVRHTLHTRHPSHKALARLHLHPGYEYGFRPGSRNARLLHALSDSIDNQALHRLLFEYGVSLAVMTALAALIGWWLAGRALRPLRRITAAARRVSGENLGERIDLQGPNDELKELATTFDGMLERLDGAFASQRHFVANASHELRTPLAIMRTEIDVALVDPCASAQELRSMGETVRDTVDRCEDLIAGLLVLARSEGSAVQQAPVDLAALAADCVTDLRGQAAEAEVEIRSALAPAWVDGDPRLLDRLVANLLDNGIRHNVPGGRLSILTETSEGRVLLEIANGGPRIDPDAVDGLMQPFRRLSRTAGGFGLGLSIVRSIAVAHRGSVALRAPGDGGLAVTIELPARPSGEPGAGRPRARAAVGCLVLTGRSAILTRVGQSRRDGSTEKVASVASATASSVTPSWSSIRCMPSSVNANTARSVMSWWTTR